MQKKILVVDDDPDILDAIQFLLEEKGYGVKTMAQGTSVEALLKQKSGLPNLIILDILLSGKDGRNITKKLKSAKITKHIPIIMISAHLHAEQSVRESGADDFLPKPFDINMLLGKVSQYLP